MTSPVFNGYPPHVIKRFEVFHTANPEVYKEFRRLAVQMRNAGRPTYGSNSIIEVLRWHRNLVTTGDEFKINNNFSPLYARLLTHYDPSFATFFKFRAVQRRGKYP